MYLLGVVTSESYTSYHKMLIANVYFYFILRWINFIQQFTGEIFQLVVVFCQTFSRLTVDPLLLMV